MPRYNVTAEFSLTTEIEPEVGRYSFDQGATEEYEDSSYWQSAELSVDGGSLSFVVVADDEENAERMASDVISDGQEIEDGNGLTWLTENVSVEIEEIEIPMDLDRAKSLIVSFLDGFEGMDEEYEEAFRFTLDLLTTIPLLAARDAEIRRLQAEVTRLGSLLTELQMAGSEAPTA